MFRLQSNKELLLTGEAIQAFTSRNQIDIYQWCRRSLERYARDRAVFHFYFDKRLRISRGHRKLAVDSIGIHLLFA